MNTDNPAPSMGTPTDAPTATRFWSDMLRASTTFWEGQLGRWSGALEQMRKGTYGGSQAMQDIVGTWDEWAMLMTTPLQLGSPTRQLPTFLFVVDGDAEFIGPAEASTSIFLPLPPGVTTVVTDLHPIGGNGTGGGHTVGPRSIDASQHVRAQLSPARDRLEVSLVDLGRGQSQRITRGIGPGLYVGAIYATEVATRRPLAVVYVLVEETTVP